jgi:hypothetical protein
MNHESTSTNQRANTTVGMETPNMPCQKNSIVSTNSAKSYVHIVLRFRGSILEEYWERGTTTVRH